MVRAESLDISTVVNMWVSMRVRIGVKIGVRISMSKETLIRSFQFPSSSHNLSVCGYYACSMLWLS